MEHTPWSCVFGVGGDDGAVALTAGDCGRSDSATMADDAAADAEPSAAAPTVGAGAGAGAAAGGDSGAGAGVAPAPVPAPRAPRDPNAKYHNIAPPPRPEYLDREAKVSAAALRTLARSGGRVVAGVDELGV